MEFCLKTLETKIKLLFIILILTAANIMAQYHYSGKIVDQDGMPLAGVQVVLAGHKDTSITDVSGIFQIQGEVSVNLLEESNPINHSVSLNLQNGKLEYYTSITNERLSITMIDLEGRELYSQFMECESGKVHLDFAKDIGSSKLFFINLISSSKYHVIKVLKVGENYSYRMIKEKSLDDFLEQGLKKEIEYNDSLIIKLPEYPTKVISLTQDTLTEMQIELQYWKNYQNKHLSRISPYSWDKPQRYIYLRSTSGFTDEEIDAIASRAQVLGVTDKEKFIEKYPNRLYGFGYMNLEKDYASEDTNSGHWQEAPEDYVYNSDGTPLLGAGCPYYNLLEPTLRDWWMGKVDEQWASAPQDGMYLSVDALVKAYDIGGANSNYTNYWGDAISPVYRDEGLRVLLARLRDEHADDFLILGNFVRPNRPGGLISWANEYTNIQYLENWERLGAGYINNANLGIQYNQEMIQEGQVIVLNVVAGKKPTPIPEMTIEEKRTKASTSMPELWESLDSAEQDELANIYAYFDFKLGMFLMFAGEHSYFRYVSTVVKRTAGTNMFKVIQPFPEWDMALGPPLELGQQHGNVWTRRFTHVEVVLDLDNGEVFYLEPGSLPLDEDGFSLPKE